MIVFDLRYDATHHSRVEFWLQSIVVRAGDVSVLLVGTHADDKKFKEEGALQSALEDIANEFVNRFPCIKLITAVSCLDGQGFEELKGEISKEALKMKHIGEILPKPYMLLESAISSVKDDKKANNEPPIIQWNEFTSIAATCHIHSNDALRAATSFLHDLGVLLHYTDEGHDGLNQMVVIDPQWLIDMAVCFILFCYILILFNDHLISNFVSSFSLKSSQQNIIFVKEEFFDIAIWIKSGNIQCSQKSFTIHV